ncbi:SigE family RNA polymerase sigma factor [Phytomonospora endophytica]|uniref:RNA polymerase sigma-70 factor (Sigma-E family) n=1 Tax=Phytomonospora endophytica TaxID=714109 RepID=A0A841FP85_9ACTN|nr:SigE family RNA polymerase sigma factor [Phytomonospora endophytica]MBB6037915.1 RNA polymerase sigma-70 factor (sigma-E family) [Phytomonospora endophytica]GIG68815.1 DNA-directed RNA polymerase sigma-70 factor [Phytomonospora endophytica]
MKPAHEREFAEFVTARSPRLLRLAYLLTGDVHLAQDLLQTSLMACQRRWVRVRELDQPFFYVRKVMYRQQSNWWRSRRRRPEVVVPDLPDTEGGGDPAESYPDRGGLIAALRALPPRQRAVVVLRYYEDRPEAEVAELLKISPGTVRSQASRALSKLRATYPEWNGSPRKEALR